MTQLRLARPMYGFPYSFHRAHDGGFGRSHKKKKKKKKKKRRKKGRRSEGLRNPAEIKPKLTGANPPVSDNIVRASVLSFAIN